MKTEQEIITALGNYRWMVGWVSVTDPNNTRTIHDCRERIDLLEWILEIENEGN